MGELLAFFGEIAVVKALRPTKPSAAAPTLSLATPFGGLGLC